MDRYRDQRDSRLEQSWKNDLLLVIIEAVGSIFCLKINILEMMLG